MKLSICIYIYIYIYMCVCVCVSWHLKSVPLKRKIEWCPICLLWWKSSCDLQGMCGLQGPTKENIPTFPFEIIHSSFTNQTNLTHSTRSDICSHNQHNSYAATNIEQDPHMNQLLQQTSDIPDLKHMKKSLFEQMGTMLNLTTVLTEIK
jgi:hypothetical protein